MSDITGNIIEKSTITGEITVNPVYPKLEDLIVTPSKEQQTFNHLNSYGYDNVVVKGIDTESSNGTTLTNEQIEALNNMFKIASYVEDPTPTYSKFKTAFNIEDTGNDDNTGDNEVVEYTITRNLISCTTSNSEISIENGKSHTETITANDGYTLTDAIVIVTMNGVNITDTVYENGTITIPEVTGDVVIIVEARIIEDESVINKITRNLTNCTSSKSITSVKESSSYTETITANEDYTLDNATVIVTMNGIDVTDAVYENGVITISEVTGDIVITVEAKILEKILYQLTNETFDGTRYIDTGVTPWIEDTDWSIVMNADHVADSTEGIFRIFGALNSVDPWEGISLQRTSVKTNYLQMQYMSAKAVPDDFIATLENPEEAGDFGDFTPIQTNTSFNIKLVLNHAKGSDKMSYSVITNSDASTLISGELTDTFTSVTAQLSIAKTGSKYWKGTMNEFILRERTLSSTEINEFMGCEV